MGFRKQTAQERHRSHTVSFVFFTILAIVFIIAGPVWAVKQYRFIEKTVRTTAVVTKIEIPNPVNPTYKPTFKFQTPSQHQWEVRAPYATAFWDYSVGQNIVVRYDPDDPKSAIPVGWFGLWTGPLMVTLFGCVCCTAIGFDWIGRRSSRDRNNLGDYSVPDSAVEQLRYSRGY